MNKVKRFKKIGYAPGMLSLITLPFLFLLFANKTIHRLPERAIPICWVNPDLINKYPEKFSAYRGYFPPQRSYQEVALTGEDECDRKKLTDARIAIRGYLATQDTIRGIHFHFGNHATYGSFIMAVDILRQEGAKTYIPYESDLWFGVYPPAKVSGTTELQPILCGTFYRLVDRG